MSQTRTPLRRERGVALITAIMFVGMTSLLVGASLSLSSTHYAKAWAEARSESALLLAEGGVNDELAQLAQSVGLPVSSLPVATPGETAVYPGESHVVYGRKGTVSATDETYWVCTTANEWWRSGSAPQVWDGMAPTFWVTASAYVKGSWRRTEVQVSKQSLFGQYAIYTNGGDDNCTSSGVSLDSTANVTITGTSGTNGKVSCSSGCTLSCGSCLNANKGNCSSAQYTSSCVRAGSSLCTRNTPYTYPTCSSCLKQCCGLSSYSDSGAWTWIKNNCNNSAGMYTYRSGASSSTISASTCTRVGYSGTTLRNFSSYNYYSNGVWDYCRSKPGTYGNVQTLVLEPGDYYFSSFQLSYDSGTELVIDPQAYASGGTPGQIRIWVYDPASNPTDDGVYMPIQMTTAAGTTTADPSLFRIYYGKDGNCLTFYRPSGCRDYLGNTLTGDFNFCGGVYAVTRTANTQGCSTTVGAQVKMIGSSGSSNGSCHLTGSMMCDKCAFSGPCKVDCNASCGHKNDPPCGAKICGSYCDGR